MKLLPDDIVKILEEQIKDDLLESSIRVRSDGFTNQPEQKHLYISVARDSFHRTVTLLREISTVHVSCPMASKESPEALELVYSFALFSGIGSFAELMVILSVKIPKDDFRIRSCTDIIPGIIIMEREAQEMLGIVVEDIPDERRFFTAPNIEEGYFPLRKKFETDETREAADNEQG